MVCCSGSVLKAVHRPASSTSFGGAARTAVPCVGGWPPPAARAPAKSCTAAVERDGRGGPRVSATVPAWWHLGGLLRTAANCAGPYMPCLATNLLVVGHEAGQEGLQVEDGLGALLQDSTGPATACVTCNRGRYASKVAPLNNILAGAAAARASLRGHYKLAVLHQHQQPSSGMPQAPRRPSTRRAGPP